MYTDLKFAENRPVYLQIKDYIQKLIVNGILRAGSRLPATRELGQILKVSRNTIILAYQYLEDDGFIHTLKGQGAFVSEVKVKSGDGLQLNWSELVTRLAKKATELDIEKNELKWGEGLISFKSIAPDERLFGMAEFRKAFLNRISSNGEKLLNYGYAKGYKPFIEYLSNYMKNKGVNLQGKDILVTNGFTEGLYLMLAVLTNPGDEIICENPTHNTALKIIKLFGLKIIGIPMTETGIDLRKLAEALSRNSVKLGYLIPSYHNPTGLVMSLEKRLAVIDIFTKYEVPIIEDGFNEELKFSGSHVAPLLALSGLGNNLIYLGSFSKILFPGLRIGWMMGDCQLISVLKSMKRSINIHTSTLDQAVLYEYLQSGEFDKYLRKVRKVYKNRHETAVELAKKYIPCKRIWGEGGLHIFVELDGIDSREVLADCYKKGVLFLPGDIFYTDDSGWNTFRLGISRVDSIEMEKGFKIIGEIITNYHDKKEKTNAYFSKID